MRLSAHNALRSALAASLIAHAALGWCFGQVRLNTQPWLEPQLPVLVHFNADDLQASDLQIKLGIDESTSTNGQWLGVATVEEAQQARSAELEQAALTLQSPANAPSVSDQTQAPRVPPLPPARPAWPNHSTVAHDPDAPATRLDADAIHFTTIEPALHAVTSPTPLSAPPPRISPTPAMSPPPAQPESAAATAGQSAAFADINPGRVSDQEAPGTSMQEPITWRPNGQVLAAHGLEISTRAPRFSIAARLTQVPRNAIVCMNFGRDGIVKKAWFIAPKGTPPGTGSKEIDDSILHAIYRWRAKGDPLLSLSESDPDDAVTITVRILL